MRHSCRCALHPVLTLLAVGTLGSVVGIGIHMWLEPVTSAVALAIGAVAGLLVSHVIGQDLVIGLGIGAAITLLALGVRALVSILSTLQHPPSMASARVWFQR